MPVKSSTICHSLVFLPCPHSVSFLNLRFPFEVVKGYLWFRSFQNKFNIILIAVWVFYKIPSTKYFTLWLWALKLFTLLEKPCHFLNSTWHLHPICLERCKANLILDTNTCNSVILFLRVTIPTSPTYI